jgi:uncharacterized protein YeaO (DUF488 family)
MTHQQSATGMQSSLSELDTTMPVRIKRAYDPIDPVDGQRVLVDRLWPRGLKKESLELRQWLKDAGPSTALRRWFNHDTRRWPEFRRRYFTELDAQPDVTQQLLDMSINGPITLLYSARDREHNQAVVLKDYLEERLREVSSPARGATATATTEDAMKKDCEKERGSPNNAAAATGTEASKNSPLNQGERDADGESELAPPPDEDWDAVLQASWESFPASDAPGWR